MVGKTGRHGRGARPVPPWRLLAPPRVWHIELQAQRQVRTTEMVVGPPPLQMGEQFAGQLCGGPGAPRPSRPGMAQSEIDSLHTSSMERAGEAERFEAVGEVGKVATTCGGNQK